MLFQSDLRTKPLCPLMGLLQASVLLLQSSQLQLSLLQGCACLI